MEDDFELKNLISATRPSHTNMSFFGSIEAVSIFQFT